MRQHQSTLRSFLSPNKSRKGGKERKRATNILIVHPFNKKRIGEYGINKITTKKKNSHCERLASLFIFIFYFLLSFQKYKISCKVLVWKKKLLERGKKKKGMNITDKKRE